MRLSDERLKQLRLLARPDVYVNVAGEELEAAVAELQAYRGVGFTDRPGDVIHGNAVDRDGHVLWGLVDECGQVWCPTCRCLVTPREKGE